MKKILYILILLTISQPALAQDLSPIQQYLQNEAGYAPPELAQQVPQDASNIDATAPYAIAQTAAPDTDADQHINSGIMGMNF